MKKVSPAGEELFSQIVSWELLGATDLNPKELLRSASTEDLYIVMENLSRDQRAREFLVAKMVDAEVLHREGLLIGDWEVSVSGRRANLRYTPVTAISRPSLTLHLSGAIS